MSAARNFLAQIVATGGIQLPTGAGAGKVAQSDASGNVSWVSPSTKPSLVSSLPGSPADGEEIYYQNTAMAEKGAAWHLRYRSGSSSAHKWECVGGGLLLDGPAGSMKKSTEGLVELTSGPKLTVPVTGDYEVTLGLNWQNESESLTAGQAWLCQGTRRLTELAVYNMVGTRYYEGGRATNVVTVALTAGQTVNVGVSLVSPHESTFSTAVIGLRPVRVG